MQRFIKHFICLSLATSAVAFGNPQRSACIVIPFLQSLPYFEEDPNSPNTPNGTNHQSKLESAYATFAIGVTNEISSLQRELNQLLESASQDRERIINLQNKMRERNRILQQSRIRATGSLPSFPYWEHNVLMPRNSSGVIVGREALPDQNKALLRILTASHVLPSNFKHGRTKSLSVAGNDYPIVHSHTPGYQHLPRGEAFNPDLSYFEILVGSEEFKINNQEEFAVPVHQYQFKNNNLVFQKKDGLDYIDRSQITNPISIRNEAQLFIAHGLTATRLDPNNPENFLWNRNSGKTKRWSLLGVANPIDGVISTENYKSFGYYTQFAEHCTVGQAAPGDSGGAIFLPVVNENGQLEWRLVGIMLAVDSADGVAQAGKDNSFILELGFNNLDFLNQKNSARSSNFEEESSGQIEEHRLSTPSSQY